MQDRYRQIDEMLLRRTAGPYIGSKGEELGLSRSSQHCPSERTSLRRSGASGSRHKPASSCMARDLARAQLRQRSLVAAMRVQHVQELLRCQGERSIANAND